MLEEWCQGSWKNAELTVWDVLHYEDGCKYAIHERAGILKACEEIMAWCVIYVLRICAKTYGISKVERADHKTQLFNH